MPKILVADDSPSTLQSVAMMLEEAGHEVVMCANGHHAIHALRREAFDLIVTDLYMPDRDGLEVISAKRKICPAVPVVAMSGMGGDFNMLPIASRQGCHTIRKPFTKTELIAVVDAALTPAQGGVKGGPREPHE